MKSLALIQRKDFNKFDSLFNFNQRNNLFPQEIVTGAFTDKELHNLKRKH